MKISGNFSWDERMDAKVQFYFGRGGVKPRPTGQRRASRAVPARGWALQRLSGAFSWGHGYLRSKLSALMAKAPTRRNGQALPGAFGANPGHFCALQPMSVLSAWQPYFSVPLTPPFPSPPNSARRAQSEMWCTDPGALKWIIRGRRQWGRHAKRETRERLGVLLR